MNVNQPLVCDMDVFTPAQREAHILATTQLMQSVQTVNEIKQGYRFSFPNETAFIFQIVEFIANERLCCPFLEFTVNVPPDSTSISLSLAGPIGTQEFLRAELNGVIE